MAKEGLQDKKIIVWDHNRDLIYQRAQTYFDDPEAAKYIWGIGFHWYEDWSGGQPMYENIKRVHEAYRHARVQNKNSVRGLVRRFHPAKYSSL